MTRYPDLASLSRRLTACICAAALISTYGSPVLAQAPKDKAPDTQGSEDKAPAKTPPAAESTSPTSPEAGQSDEGQPPARPEPDEATRKAAKEALAEADEAFAAEDYEVAHAKYVESNALAPSPAAHYGEGMSLVELDRPTEAYSVLTELMSSPDRDELGDEKLAAAQRQINELEKIPGTVALTTVPKTATVSVDGAVKPGSSPRHLELPPGKHTITIEAPGFETNTLEVDLKPAETKEEQTELMKTPPPEPAQKPAPPETAKPEPKPEPPPQPKEQNRVPAYVTLGVAGASAIVGTIFGIKALQTKSDFDKNPTTKAADDTERNALIADMALGVTITLGVTGIVLLTSDEPSEAAARAPAKRQRAQVQIAPYISPKGTSGGATAKVTF